MEVIFTTPVKIGNRSFKKTAKGKTEAVSSSLAYNLAFKKLIVSGVVQLVPLDAAKQKTRMAHDAKVHAHAKAKRLETLKQKAAKASQTAQGASSAIPSHSSASGSDQTLPTPAKPSGAGVAAKASAPVTPVTAQKV